LINTAVYRLDEGTNLSVPVSAATSLTELSAETFRDSRWGGAKPAKSNNKMLMFARISLSPPRSHEEIKEQTPTAFYLN